MSPRTLTTTLASMRDRLIVNLIHGDPVAWGAIGILWLLTAVLVLVRSPGAMAKVPWLALTLTTTTATSLVGLSLAAAVCVPRIRWRSVDDAALLGASPDTWRRLRGPSVVLGGPAPDSALPTIDTEERWMLYGLLSGRPLDGYSPIAAVPMELGSTRVCRTDREGCRPWPASWPEPGAMPTFDEFEWGLAGAHPEDALAYDVETSLFLRRVNGHGGEIDPQAVHLEVVGNAHAVTPRDGPSVVLVIRRILLGRLRAARIRALPSPTGGHVFHLDRSDVSLIAGRRAFTYFAQPVLSVTSFTLPAGLLVYLLAPLAARVAGSGDDLTRREALALIGPFLAAAVAFAASLAVAAPAVVAMISLWGSRY